MVSVIMVIVIMVIVIMVSVIMVIVIMTSAECRYAKCCSTPNDNLRCIDTYDKNRPILKIGPFSKLRFGYKTFFKLAYNALQT